MSSSPAQRIIIVGSSNSGKSTLGQRLATRMNVPFIELDALYWQPGWVEPEIDEFRERVCRAIHGDSWVLAGNYSLQVDISWPLADMVIWLDLPLLIALRRCIVRSWRRYRSQELLWGTNREKFWEHLMLWNPKKSLISYTIVRHRARRRWYEEQMRDARWSHIVFVRLTSVEEIEQWVAALPYLAARQRLGHVPCGRLG